MPVANHRRRSSLNIWPGFVDALATLLLVIIFVLLVFVLAQFFLTQTLASRDAALQGLQGELAALAETLSLERRQAAERQSAFERVQGELAASLTARRQLESAGTALAGRAEAAEGALATERQAGEAARAEAALLSRQLAAVQEQLAALAAALDVSEKKSAEQAAQIAGLGQRLNAALASKVEELARYRSEFFGRLREALGDRPDVRIVGDRFILPAEVLFATGSADLGADGKAQLIRLANTLKGIANRIPTDIDWILQVEGHTDKVPINTPAYPSNWELSTARAVSVIRLLMELGIPSRRLAAAGYGEFHPIDPGDSEAAMQRNRRIELKLTQR